MGAQGQIEPKPDITIVNTSHRPGKSGFLTVNRPYFILLAVFLIIVSLTAYYTLDEIEEKTKESARQNLESVNATTHTALTIWVEDLQQHIKQFTENTELVSLTKQQLRIERTPEKLLNSPALDKLRTLYASKDKMSDLGFFIIAPDHISIASKRNSNVGSKNLIALQRPDLIERIFQGHSVLVPPITSDVPIEDNGVISETMFIASPIRDEMGNIIAAITIRINPYTTFSRLLHLGQTGNSNRTYAFDPTGQAFIDTTTNSEARLPVNIKRTAQHIIQTLGPDKINLNFTNSGLNTSTFTVTDMEGYLNHRGDRVFGSFTWDPRLGMGIATEATIKSAMAGYTQSRNTIIMLYLITIMLSATILMTIVWLTRRNSIRLQEERNSLEIKVKQRTQDLMAANQALEHSNIYLDSVIAAIPDAILTVDTNGVITDASPQTETLLGYQRNELVGKKIEMLIPERLRDKHLQLRLDMMSSGKTTLKPSQQLVVLNKEGREINIDISVNAFKHDDRWIAIAALRDISDRVRTAEQTNKLQKQVAQTKKMETIGRLTGGIAHDFNNMLTSILGFAELASRSLPENNTKLSNYLQAIQQSSLRASELVKQMLAFSRGDSNKANPISPAPVLKEALKMLRATIPSSIKIELSIKEPGATILADSTQLHQVIMNLVINSRDALNNRGKIKIGLEKNNVNAVCSSCHDSVSGQFIELYIQDNGPGIDKETLQHIFDPFYTTKAVGKGSGLGLSMVHGVVHSSQGHVLAQSAPDRGTMIRLLFPEYNQQTIANNVERDIKGDFIPTRKRETILVVDDEETIIAFMTELLESWGYHVSAFSNPRDALESFKNEPEKYDLIITDQTMPDLLGTELAQKIRSKNPNVPIILYTGYSEGVDEESVTKYGINAYFQKPLDMKTLQTTIHNTLHHKQLNVG